MQLVRTCPNCAFNFLINQEDTTVKCPRCGANLRLLGQLMKIPTIG